MFEFKVNLKPAGTYKPYVPQLDADTGVTQVTQGSALPRPVLPFALSRPKRGSMTKENMRLGWQSVWVRGPLGSSGRCAPLGPQWSSDPYRLPSSAHISWVPSCVRIAEAHKY